MARITVTLSELEKVALQSLAEANLRGVKEELRFILRKEASKKGLPLTDEDVTRQAYKITVFNK